MKNANKLMKLISLLLIILSVTQSVYALDKSRTEIGADKLNELGITGKSNTICLIDDGVDYTNQYLGGCTHVQYESGACSTVIIGKNIRDNTINISPKSSQDHGTHVAGILISNHSKYRGISPDAKLAVVKVYSNIDDTSSCQGFVDAIDWCVANSQQYNITVISLSYGLNPCQITHTSEFQRAISNATSKGISFVKSAGNTPSSADLNMTFPANLTNVTAVGSTTRDSISRFTRRLPSDKLDLLAPGHKIRSTKNGGGLSPFLNEILCLNDLTVFTYTLEVCDSGTSYATPHVSAAVALVKQYDPALRPNDVERLLKNTGSAIQDSVTGQTFKKINLLNALGVLDWPTNRHDNRRTGTTLLKGDMKKASDVDNLNLFLTNANDQEYVIRTSIADLDNNGYMEAVSVAHEQWNAVIGNLFSFERQKKWESCPSFISSCWRNKKKWIVNLNRSVLSPPTAGNIDATSRKEVLAPRRNSSLLVFDVGSNGETISQLWEFIVPSKYSAFLNEFNRGELTGSAIEDIDLDGTADVILTDWLSRGVPDWPAQVYVLNSTGKHMFNATFGNGGAYGSPSVANIDNDDYPEVIIPSFYGVFVYDYNAANKNFSLRWNNSDGLIDGEVVVYDIDRDNDYELIYSTATQGCSSQKKCFNRTYIRDAKTGANEGPSPISYTNLITRVAPTISNLDSDSNNEIAVIGTNQKSSVSNLGKLVAYDANTGSQEWVYDDGGNLKVAFASPDIADITGDGNLDVIFAENNGSKVYIIKKDGTLDFTYTFSAFIDNALAIGDLDSDGKAEIALKRAGSPVAFSTLTGFNEPPELQDIDNITAIAGNSININSSGQILATDPDDDALNYTYGAPFNGSGLWQTTVNDTGNYSIVVEASDGNLTSIKFVDVFVFNASTSVVTNFSDGSSKKLLNFTQAGNQTVQIKIPKKSVVKYSRLKVGGYNS